MPIPDFAKSLDRLFLGLYEKGYFEGSYYCDHAGIEVFGAVGKRNPTEACNESTRFFIGSLDKTLAAILALLAIEEKRLEWKASIGDFLPTRLDYSIGDLCSHTPGIHDVVNDDSLLGKYRTLEELCELIEQRECENGHKKEFSYCSTNYVLLWAVLRKVYGMAAGEL